MIKREKRHSIIAIALLIIAIFAFAWGYRIIKQTPPINPNITFGATFSIKYANELNIDWKKAFLASIVDLNIKKYRIPIYWDIVEKQQNSFDFSDYDWLIQQANKYDAQIFFAIGRKVPRWPECFTPQWAKQLKNTEQEKRVLILLEKIITRYKNNKAIVAWQIENEPLFPFGKCPKPSYFFLKKEINLVKKLDSIHKIIITDSGELSSWIRAGISADILGISLYRVAFNKHFGYWYYPLTPAFYKDRIKLSKPLVKKVIVSELQAEPWVDNSITKTPMAIQDQTMNQHLLETNFDFVSRVGVKEAYLWGIEWWFWLKEQGNNNMWDKGKELIKKYNRIKN